jgi:hypothetical protein
MNARHAFAAAILVWYATDVGHTSWHVHHGDTIGTLIAEIAIDAGLAFAAASAVWLPLSLGRSIGGLAALLVGAFSLVRGISPKFPESAGGFRLARSPVPR